MHVCKYVADYVILLPSFYLLEKHVDTDFSFFRACFCYHVRSQVRHFGSTVMDDPAKRDLPLFCSFVSLVAPAINHEMA